MEATFTINGGYIFARLRFDESQVSGYGASVAPRLMLQFQLDLLFPQIQANCRIDLLRLSGKLQFGNNIYIDAVPAIVLHSISARVPTNSGCSVTLEFPTTPAVIAAIEQVRAGGNLKATFHVFLEYDVMRLAGNGGQTGLWAVEQRAMAPASQTMEFPSSAWIGRVLPQVGYGTIHVLEFPVVPLEEYEGFKESFKALSQAREWHNSGFYDDAVSKCRIALDKFFEIIDTDDGRGGKKKVPQLKAAWQTRLGRTTYDWLNSALGEVKSATNVTHHSPNPHFDQLESQMLIAITTAFVAYAARNTPENRTG